jgi:hypothetical protein
MMTNDNWRIDTSTGTKILMYKDCSVIEDAQADLVMSLLQPQEAVAVLIADPMFLPALNVPLMDWKVDVTNLPIGTELYTSQPNDKAEIARLNEALNAVIDTANQMASSMVGCDKKIMAEAMNSFIKARDNALAMKGE